MICEKNKFLTVSWLSGLLSAEIFISTGEWGVQMPSLTSENSHFLRSGPQETTLVMSIQLLLIMDLLSVFYLLIWHFIYLILCMYSALHSKTCRMNGLQDNLTQLIGSRHSSVEFRGLLDAGPIGPLYPALIWKSGLRKHTLFQGNLIKSHPISGKFDKITPYFREIGLSKSTLQSAPVYTS